MKIKNNNDNCYIQSASTPYHLIQNPFEQSNNKERYLQSQVWSKPLYGHMAKIYNI